MEWVQPIIQLTTAGGFGALVWYLIVRQIPQQEERHRVDRQQYMTQLKELTVDYHKALMSNTSAIEELTRELRRGRQTREDYRERDT